MNAALFPQRLSPVRAASPQMVNLPDLAAGTSLSIMTARSVYQMFVADPATGLVVCSGGTQPTFQQPRVGYYDGATRDRRIVSPLVIQTEHGLSIRPFRGDVKDRVGSSLVISIQVVTEPAFAEVARELLRALGFAAPPATVPIVQSEDDRVFDSVVRVLESLPDSERERACAFVAAFCPVGRVLLAKLFQGAVAKRKLPRLLDFLQLQYAHYWSTVDDAKRGALLTAEDRRRATLLFQFVELPLPLNLPVVVR